MSDDPTAEYHAKRERQERELAAAAIDPAVRGIHLALADRYARLVNEADPVRSRLSLFQ